MEALTSVAIAYRDDFDGTSYLFLRFHYEVSRALDVGI